MHILLVEPSYYTRYPPLGLLKLASYHRLRGDTVELVRGSFTPDRKPDRIYVTSLFTWGWKEVWQAVWFHKNLYPTAEVRLGGIYASLMPEHAKHSGADYVHTGLFQEAEDLMPAYDLVPQWQWSIMFASRGCPNHCPYCAVPRLEGELHSLKSSVKPFIFPGHKRIIFWDNNILAAPNWKPVVTEIMELGVEVDFNQGLDASFVTKEVAETLSKMKMPCVRLSYDYKGKRKYVKKAIELITSCGIRGREIFVYVLYNFNDKSDDFFERVRDVLTWGAVVFPMRFEPLDSIARNKYISPSWDKNRLEMVEKVRRVLGFSGSLPPYAYLVKKFSEAAGFDEAFREPERLFDNGKKRRAHRIYNIGWMNGERDWRAVLPGFARKQW